MKNIYKEAIEKYLGKTGQEQLTLKAVLFDMDGVLFDSMPFHTKAWQKTMETIGIHADIREFFAHEGRTAKQTINIFFERNNRSLATDDEVKVLYKVKEAFFNQYPKAPQMYGALDLVKQMKLQGLNLGVVTGSSQGSLLIRLEKDYPSIFNEKILVTALDVKHGKPDPEPYLMGLQKAGAYNNEAIVIENAPLGVEAAIKAGIFTIAVNTGPLDKQLLIDAGADLIFDSMEELSKEWNNLYKLLKV